MKNRAGQDCSRKHETCINKNRHPESACTLVGVCFYLYRSRHETEKKRSGIEVRLVLSRKVKEKKSRHETEKKRSGIEVRLVLSRKVKEKKSRHETEKKRSGIEVRLVLSFTCYGKKL